MIFKVSKKERVVGGKEIVIENLNGEFINKIRVASYSIKSEEDIVNEITKFYNIDKQDVRIIYG